MTKAAVVMGMLGVGALAGASALAWRFAIFVAPFAWTGEPQRLAEVLQLREGSRVADIGAGDGALASAMADVVGPGGRVFATELSAERRAAIAERAARAGRDGRPVVEVVAAQETATGLPDGCCDAVYLRAMLHHVADRPAFAAAVARAVRPGGRIAVIDFPPGALWFHGRDHGVRADAVVAAFRQAGWTPVSRGDDWGGGMFLVVFERPAATR